MDTAFLALGLICAVSVGICVRQWPAQTGGVLAHSHPELPVNHPHLDGATASQHSHSYIIDDLHIRWPTQK
jgi:hypothetical protein